MEVDFYINPLRGIQSFRETASPLMLFHNFPNPTVKIAYSPFGRLRSTMDQNMVTYRKGLNVDPSPVYHPFRLTLLIQPQSPRWGPKIPSLMAPKLHRSTPDLIRFVSEKDSFTMIRRTHHEVRTKSNCSSNRVPLSQSIL